MRRPPSFRSVSAVPSNALKPTLKALLPPILLYRRLFRVHRKFLPYPMRLLGNETIKNEFRAHRNVTNPAQIITFLTQWQLYAQEIEGNSWHGQRLDKTMVDNLNDDQLRQIHELMKTIRSRGDGTEGQ